METEGLVLSATPFQESDHILTLFTPNALLKLFVKGKRRLDAHHQAIISPFTVASYTYRTTKSDLGRLIEAKIQDQNLKLRDRLSSFETAQKILHTIYKTQWQNKATPALYLLTIKFLSEIPKQAEPEKLFAPFLVKMLKHEGVLDVNFFEEPRHIQAIANARSFESLATVLPDEELCQKIEEYYSSLI